MSKGWRRTIGKKKLYRRLESLLRTSYKAHTLSFGRSSLRYDPKELEVHEQESSNLGRALGSPVGGNEEAMQAGWAQTTSGECMHELTSSLHRRGYLACLKTDTV